MHFELMKLLGKKRYLPLFTWFERLTHLVTVEFMLREFAPDLVRARLSDLAEKQHLLGVMAALAANVQASLRRLAHWMARFLGYCVIGPHCPNRQWADSAETVATLVDAGLVRSEGGGLDGSSCLRNREVADAIGEFVFGIEVNPFRANELFFPKAYESRFERPRPDEGGRQAEEALDE